MRDRSAFTLIDTLIAVAILAILAGITYPMVSDVAGFGSSVSMAGTVKIVRDQIQYHRAVGDVPLSNEGYPNLVRPSWFVGGSLPHNPWTHEPLNIHTIHGPKSAKLPNSKTFNITPQGKAAGHTAWYNAANGSFCVLVPNQQSIDADQLFYQINISSLPSHGAPGTG